MRWEEHEKGESEFDLFCYFHYDPSDILSPKNRETKINDPEYSDRDMHTHIQSEPSAAATFFGCI